MYSLDQFLAKPPLPAILAQFLFLGCDFLGLWVLQIIGFKKMGFYSWQRWQAPMLGILILGIILNPVSMAGWLSLNLLKILAVGIALLGLYNLYFIITPLGDLKILFTRFWQLLISNKGYLLIFFLLLGYWLLAACPVTDADSLDYHMGVAIDILNNGGMPFIPEWFHGRLAGNGEMLNAFGLSIGVEQFGSYMQFAGIFSIAGLLLFGELFNVNEESGIKSDTRIYITIAAISAPVIIALINPKPQLMPIAMTTLAFYLLITQFKQKLSHEKAIRVFLLICMLVMFASQTKFNYLLGGGVIGIVAFIEMIKRRFLVTALFISVFSSLIIVLPTILWKMHFYNAGFFESIFNPLPGKWPGTSDFENYLRTYRDTRISFPFSLIIPSNINTVTTVIGIGLVLLFGIKSGKNKWVMTGLIMAIFVGVTTVYLGPKTSRSYLEPFFWILLLITTGTIRSGYLSNKLIISMCLIQGIMSLFFCWYGIFTLLPGSINSKLRENVMDAKANGYTILKWADSVLPKNSILIHNMRSEALVPRPSFNTRWMRYVDINSRGASVYMDEFWKKGITHILVIGKSPHDFSNFKDCVGKLIAGPRYSRKATRNPFNQGEVYYEGWIYEFHPEKMSNFSKVRNF